MIPLKNLKEFAITFYPKLEWKAGLLRSRMSYKRDIKDFWIRIAGSFFSIEIQYFAKSKHFCASDETIGRKALKG